VKKGGTGATTAGGALQNLLPSYTSNDGKVLGLTGGAPAWVAQTSSDNLIMTPDYGSMETTNRIVTNDGEWIAQGIGYVYLAIPDSGGFSTGTATINGKIVLSVGNNATGSNIATSGVFPVRKGDKIQFNSDNIAGNENTSNMNLGCYFIPPIYSTPPTPIVVDEGVGGSYLLSEVQTNDTWINGEPIYKQTFKILSPSDVSNTTDKTNTTLLPAGIVDLPIKHEVIFHHSTDAWAIGPVYYTIADDFNYSAGVVKASSGEMTSIIRLASSATHYTSRDVYITVWYTKL
jgi:hypothetical protein